MRVLHDNFVTLAAIARELGLVVQNDEKLNNLLCYFHGSKKAGESRNT